MVIPESTKTSLRHKLEARRRERWPGLSKIEVRYRANFVYVSGIDTEGVELELFRLRYNRSASLWGFAIYLASKDGYEDSVLPSGMHAGSPEEALDCACGLYLNEPEAWSEATGSSPKNF